MILLSKMIKHNKIKLLTKEDDTENSHWMYAIIICEKESSSFSPKLETQSVSNVPYVYCTKRLF